MSEADSNTMIDTNINSKAENGAVESPQQNNDVDVKDQLDLLDVPDEELLLNDVKEIENAVQDSDKSEALNLLLQGKRNILVKDYESAVTTLSDACQRYAAIYGDLGDECGQVYLAYGHALLELWRNEEKLSQNDNNDTPGENADEEVDEKVKEPLEKVTEEDGDDEQEVSDNEEEEAGNVENEETIQSKCAEDENSNDEEEVDEEPDNLELAWEILELAKKIYERENGDRTQLAKVYSKLGEISIASNNHSLAVDDLKRSLDIQLSAPILDARFKANTHFLLHVAHSMNCNFNEADNELRAAKSTCRDRLNELAQLDDATAAKIVSEITELEQIVADINAKMRDSVAERRKLLSTVTEIVKKRIDGSSSSGASSSVSTSADSLDKSSSPLKASPELQVNNISHLVRKKPKEQQSQATPSEATVETKCNGTDANKSNSNVPNTKSSEPDEQVVCKKRKADDQEQPESGEPKKVCPEPV